MKGLVKVKGSWGMGGGLRGVASFSLSWDSVSMPVAIFSAARRFLRAAVRLYLCCPRRRCAAAARLRVYWACVQEGSGMRRRHERAGRVRLLAPSRPLSRLAAGLQQSIIT